MRSIQDVIGYGVPLALCVHSLTQLTEGISGLEQLLLREANQPTFIGSATCLSQGRVLERVSLEPVVKNSLTLESVTESSRRRDLTSSFASSIGLSKTSRLS